MKTAEDSYTITKKQIVRFQERSWNFLTESNSKWPTIAIISLDRPDIG